ncbi:MAG: radical SAM protein [Candidatus Omnitrophica bacterium]|nr:radical SAM protein [Candidatus Omnitrophota bacterium]
MKVALIQCPGWGRDCPPYSVALLSAILRNKGHKAFGFDLNNALYCSGPDKYKKMWEDKDQYSFWSNRALIAEFIAANERMINFQIDKILDTQAKMIGFTIHFSSLLVSLELARRIKKADKDRIIIFGGSDCSRELRGKELIKEDAVDIVAVGEGDETLPELATIFDTEGRVEFSPGTLLKKGKKIVDCGDRLPVESLDFLPFPDYSDFRKDILSGHYRQPERLEILDSRGCFTRCHFCSEWQFWKTFRSMSGKRIFEEIAYQIQRYPGVNYFYFIGSLLNGNIKELTALCDLLIGSGLKVKWSGQAVIRPEMTKDLLGKMSKAGCEWLGYGIESGSQRVVKNMHKHFSIANAEEVLENTHQARIGTQANFMFGIPTETEEDFKKTLEFLQRNRENIDSVLASQSFCVIDKGTYLYTHAQELGIVNAQHHLYWEAENNTYLDRFRRYEEFCRLALALGLPETSGVLKVKPDKWLLLGDYFLFKKDYPLALECFQKSLKLESRNGTTLKKITECQNKLKNKNKSKSAGRWDFLKTAKTGIRVVLDKDKPDSVELTSNLTPVQEKVKDALLKLGLQDKLNNFLLIEREKEARQQYLSGYPYWLTIDPANSCNLKCPFCPTGQSRGTREKSILTFDNFKKVIDELGPYLIHADFCNWGEPFLNPNLAQFIKYAKQFKIDTKVDSNLNLLNEKTAEDIILSGLDKLIVSIDGATSQTYSKYRVGGDFDTAINNLKILIKKRNHLGRPNPYICWQFLVFRHNEHEIDLVKKIGQDLGVDSVSITKAFIGNPDWFPLNKNYSHYRKTKNKEKNTSGYFKQTPNKACNWPWEEIVINPNGSVSACCSVEDEKDDFGNVFQQPFSEIWNNSLFRQARRYIKYRSAPDGGEHNVCIGCKHAGMTNIDILSCHSLFACPGSS